MGSNWYRWDAANGSPMDPILPDNRAKNTETSMKKPPSLVWLPADHRLLGDDDQKMPFLVLGDKYARAVKESAGVQPVVFPLANAADIDGLLDLVDGVMLTGSPSNIHPSHFGEAVADTTLPLDEHRDALTLSLVKACVARSIPLFGVCRGFQEINVSMGGSLKQQVHAETSMLDHREDRTAPLSVRYGPAHEVKIEADSAMAQWAGAQIVQVNSLHGQGVGRLAQGLQAVAHAPDGLVEAFEVQGAKTFACAVQWHPEWRTADNPFYSAMFKAFGDACRVRQSGRHLQR